LTGVWEKVAKVEIYTKTFCGYCWRARGLLEAKGVEFEEYVIDSGGLKREEMIQRAKGRTTVPQIFIDGRHIGGCTDLLALERDGKLNALLIL
jgi:glutaredoxin 3